MVVQCVADGKGWMPFRFAVETQHLSHLGLGKTLLLQYPSYQKYNRNLITIIELVDPICRDSTDTQYMI